MPGELANGARLFVLRWELQPPHVRRRRLRHRRGEGPLQGRQRPEAPAGPDGGHHGRRGLTEGPAVDLARDDDAEVVRAVVGPVVVADHRVGQLAQLLHAAARLGLVAAAARVDRELRGAVDHVAGLVLAGLHLAVDDAGIAALAIDVVHLCHEAAVLERWEENVVQVDRQNLQEALTASGVHGVASVVDIGPSIGSLSQATVGQHIQDSLVGIAFTAQEDEMFQCVRATVIIECLCLHYKIAMDRR
mmetsp:Transcript_117189/g.326489  ORF Transcript_117189/g.326489 Transcript_117189/m.326489 type:complete len:247 (-) Transcript_117189:79-819(-)